LGKQFIVCIKEADLKLKNNIKNKNKASLSLILGLGIFAGIMLVDRFFVHIPDWLAIILFVFAIILVVMSFIKNKQR